MPYVALDRLEAEAAVSTNVGAPVPSNGMTLLDFDQELNARLLGRTDVSATRRRLFINQAYTDVCTSLKLPELQASIEIPLVANQFMYLLPPSVYSIVSAAAIDSDEDPNYGGRPLDMSDLGVFRSRPLMDDRPREYFHYTGMLVVWPTPAETGTMVIDFRIRPTWMTNDAHCPLLYVEWHEGILLKARHKALNALQEWDAAMLANNDFVQFMRARQDVLAVENENMTMRSSVPRSNSSARYPRGDPRRRWHG